MKISLPVENANFMHQPLPQEKLLFLHREKVTSGKVLYLYHPEPTEKWFLLPVGLGPFLKLIHSRDGLPLEKYTGSPRMRRVESPGLSPSTAPV